jgi:hypothetical protein
MDEPDLKVETIDHRTEAKRTSAVVDERGAAEGRALLRLTAIDVGWIDAGDVDRRGPRTARREQGYAGAQ